MNMHEMLIRKALKEAKIDVERCELSFKVVQGTFWTVVKGMTFLNEDSDISSVSIGSLCTFVHTTNKMAIQVNG